MANIISISVSDEDLALLKDYNLSPSGLFKQKMQEVRQNALNFQKDSKETLQRLEKQADRIARLYDFLEEKGLSDEFISKDGVDNGVNKLGSR